MPLFNHREFDHEQITFRHDPQTGLKAIIAIHNSNLGPAIGGCRMLAYPTEEDALADVLRLSRGMTYKCAIAGIPFGGGKMVALCDSTRDKSDAVLQAIGGFVEDLGGRYITAFDVGVSQKDAREIGKRTQYVAGIAEDIENVADSTAYGIFACMKRSAALTLNRSDLSGLRIAIQGVGKVGERLAQLAAEAKARVVIADINQNHATEVARSIDCEVVTHQEILSTDCDILAPCALGAVINDHSIKELHCKVICGGANNQLSRPVIADRLEKAGILYCPDYLANAGGIINIHYQLNNVDRSKLRPHLDSLADKYEELITLAREQSVNIAHAADLYAEKIFMQY